MGGSPVVAVGVVNKSPPLVSRARPMRCLPCVSCSPPWIPCDRNVGWVVPRGAGRGGGKNGTARAQSVPDSSDPRSDRAPRADGTH